LLSQSWRIRSSGEDVETQESLSVAGRNVEWCNCCGRELGGSSEGSYRIPIEPSNSTSGKMGNFSLKEPKAEAQKHTCTPMFTVTFTIAPRWEQPKCLISRWTNKMWYIIQLWKKNEIPTHDNIILSEISQTQKDKFYMIPRVWVPRIGKYTETGNRIEVTKEERMERWCLYSFCLRWG
jgi:hypothetical protein